ARVHRSVTFGLLSHRPPTLTPPLFFLNAPPTTETYTLSLHDALPISASPGPGAPPGGWWKPAVGVTWQWQLTGTLDTSVPADVRSEEHTSELQSQSNLVCRLLLEKKN